MSIRTGALQSAIDEMNERMEREVLGAWRAGYEYLHVYNPVVSAYDSDDPHLFSQYVLPSNRPPLEDVGDVRYAYSFELGDVDAAEVRARL
jgi:hypothetical protein